MAKKTTPSERMDKAIARTEITSLKTEYKRLEVLIKAGDEKATKRGKAIVAELRSLGS